MTTALTFTLHDVLRHGDTRVITARDVHGRIWTAVQQDDWFDIIVDPDGDVLSAWQGLQPRAESPEISERFRAFVSWALSH